MRVKIKIETSESLIITVNERIFEWVEKQAYKIQVKCEVVEKTSQDASAEWFWNFSFQTWGAKTHSIKYSLSEVFIQWSTHPVKYSFSEVLIQWSTQLVKLETTRVWKNRAN